MQDRLSIGEVSRFLSISRDTLRYFEKEKIAIPSRDENNYRYYDDWEINFLIEYKKFRAFGYNVNDTREILHKDSLVNLTDKFEKNTNDIRKKIEYYKLLLNKNNSYLKHLNEIHKKVGRFSITKMKEIFYFKMRYNNTYICKSEINELFKDWSGAFPFVDPIFITSKNSNDYYECGLSIEAYYNQILNLPMNAKVEKVKPSRSVNTVIVAGPRNSFTIDLLKPIYNFIKENNFKIIGPTIGYYLARVYENDEYKRYLEVYVPVQ